MTRLRACPLFSTLLFAAGCGAGDLPDLGEVTGLVTDSKGPVANATVEFAPEKGRPSYGTTGPDGRYTLAYTAEAPGAIVGNHVVRVTPPGAEAKPAAGREEIPVAAAKTLVLPGVEVKDGDNTIDLDLSKATPLDDGRPSAGGREPLVTPGR